MEASKKKARFEAQCKSVRVEIANKPDVDALPEYALVKLFAYLDKLYHSAQKK